MPCLALGISSFVMLSTESMLSVSFTSSLSRYGGDLAVGAMTIITSTNQLVLMPLQGICQGGQPIMSYNYGAKNKDRLKEILKFSYTFLGVLSVSLASLLALAAPLMMRLFVKDTEMIATGVPMLRLQLAGMLFVAIVLVTTTTFQSAGKALGAFLLSISRQGVFLILTLATGSALFGYYGILAAQACSDFLTALLAVFLFRKMISPVLK